MNNNKKNTKKKCLTFFKDLWRCLQKFSLAPAHHSDPKAIERLYRLFDAQNPVKPKNLPLLWFHFHWIESETRWKYRFRSIYVRFTYSRTRYTSSKDWPYDKTKKDFDTELLFCLVYFESLDVNRDRIITRDDLEQCLPATVESQQLIPQLLKQWDIVIRQTEKRIEKEIKY